MNPDPAHTTVERTAPRELVVTRLVHAPSRAVFDAWTRPEQFKLWWAPKSFGVWLESHEADVRTGGTYKLVMGHPSLDQPMAFFGRYLEVTPPGRIVWTNEEGSDAGAVTSVTFTEEGEATRIVVHEVYPTEASLDEAMASGSTTGWPEQFVQLETLLVAKSQK